MLLIMGCLAGLSLAYVDSRPAWDDTAILAGSLLLSSSLLTGVGYRRPWLMALAVGLWIPLRAVYVSHDMRMFFVLVFPLAGAYAGWATQRVIQRGLRGA